MSRNLLALFIAAAVLALPAAAGATSPDTVLLPILMYHHIDSIGDSDSTVSDNTFEHQLQWLNENGFDAVSLDDVIAYVNDGTPLPDKPYCVVFDDGYESNLTLALPLLTRFDVPATICFIGSSVGDDTYKDTGIPIIPHFGTDGARTLLASGLITLGSHTWDLHMWAPLEGGEVREYAVRLDGESERSFEEAFRADFAEMSDYMRDELGILPNVFAYPHGVWDMTTERLLRELGVVVTLTCEERVNVIRRGDADSLYLLGRYNVNESTDIESIFKNIYNMGETK